MLCCASCLVLMEISMALNRYSGASAASGFSSAYLLKVVIEFGTASALVVWYLAVNEQNPQALAAQDMLIVHFYAGEASAPFAERYASCMIEVTGLGGEGGGNVGMPG